MKTAVVLGGRDLAFAVALLGRGPARNGSCSSRPGLRQGLVVLGLVAAACAAAWSRSVRALLRRRRRRGRPCDAPPRHHRCRRAGGGAVAAPPRRSLGRSGAIPRHLLRHADAGALDDPLRPAREDRARRHRRLQPACAAFLGIQPSPRTGQLRLSVLAACQLRSPPRSAHPSRSAAGRLSLRCATTRSASSTRRLVRRVT